MLLVGQVAEYGASVKTSAIQFYQHVAEVASISVAVPANPYNTLAQQLSEKEKELSDRELQLLAQQKDFEMEYQELLSQNRLLTLVVLGGVTVLLLFLIFANFYFDIKREEEIEKQLRAPKDKII